MKRPYLDQKPRKPKVDPGFTNPPRSKKSKYGINAGIGQKPQGAASPSPAGPNKAKKKGGGINFKNYDPAAPLTGKNLKRELNAYLRTQTDPLKRQLNAEEQASLHRQNAQLPAWYQGYQSDLARLRGESQGAYDAATARVAEFSNQGAAQDADSRQGAEQRAMADAALRGVAFDPSAFQGQIEAEDARRNVQTSTLGTLAGQGANQFSYLTNRQGIAGQQQIAEMQNEGLRRRKVTEDKRELASKKGDLAAEFLRQAREDERKYLLEGKALSLDKREEKGRNFRANLTAATSIANSKRSSKTSRKNSQRTQKGQNQRQEDEQRFDKKQGKLDRRAEKKGK